ncbi:MAG: 2-oxoglutarate dehydrogenase E1 component, partial [Longimicrobiales bacterium]|nr:2-oxoglutarate dehydrogenase E1 component [Longimicrobiales bacterium]
MKDDTLFDSQNIAYAQAMFEEYARNPDSVSPEWRRLFDNGAELAIAEGLLVPDQLQDARAAGRPQQPAEPQGDALDSDQSDGRSASPATATPRTPRPAGPVDTPEPTATNGDRGSSAVAGHPDASQADRLLQLLPAVSRATALVQAFRDHGHQLARLDPLGSEPPGHPQLSPAFHGTSTDELKELPASLIIAENGKSQDGRSVADALADLGEVYAGTLGYEFEHLDDHVKVDWLWAQVEAGEHRPSLSDQRRKAILKRISEAEGLEQFLHRTYLGQKRFSLEGNDMLVPMLDLVIEETAKAGGTDVVLGMAHRGRLNVLTHTLGVAYGDLLAEFEGPSLKGGALDIEGTGDVKYHHGARGTRAVEGAGEVSVTLAPNPSHLEFVNPVVMGMARAKLWRGLDEGDEPNHDQVVPVLMHGDAAFAAEGVVAETLNMARLEGYDVGGTLHIIVNNQIGFTTDPREGRSTAYASDLAKGYGIPIVHVNADDPEACLAAIRLAMAYRRKFHDDFVIDLVGYRRHGHNEGDEPAYTQPKKYERIDEHPTVFELYSDRLIEEGVVKDSDVVSMKDEIAQKLRECQDHIRDYQPVEDDKPDEEREKPVVPETTGVDLEVLEKANHALIDVPEGFSPHPKLWRQIGKKASEFGPNKSLDWGHAETLAFGSLLMEGIPVRLTGQDSERGTFSHRHAVLHDVETGDEFVPLSTVAEAPFEIYNSPLTETAVIGFEYGYSVACDDDTVLWEAQFGDFVNVAQVMIDQFLSSGHQKWGQYSRLILLLPHGYEGQGPEHSSARLERFLQLCAEDNMRVTYPTTPAQYFHMLRRQALRRPERPMIVMTPKSLLRHPRATSSVSELTSGNFQHVLDDPTVEDREKIERLVLCSGKVYYDMQGHDRRDEADKVTLTRLELLYPFPEKAIEELVGRYPNLREVVWAQEEPRNMGG